MKTAIKITTVILVLHLFSYSGIAQVKTKDESKVITVLVDNPFIHSQEITLEPGERTEMHTHAAYFFYALSEGSLAVYYKDGTREYIEVKPGTNGYSDPEKPHITENHGNTTVKFLIIELKEHPYKPVQLNK